jgi:hypothetical protein
MARIAVMGLAGVREVRDRVEVFYH